MTFIRLIVISIILVALVGCATQENVIPTRFTLDDASTQSNTVAQVMSTTATLVPVNEQNGFNVPSSQTPVPIIITPTQPPTKTASPTWTPSQTPLPTLTAFPTSMIVPVQPTATVAFTFNQPTQVPFILPTVNICAIPWGFGGYPLPGCPSAPMRIDNAAYQSFYMADTGARGHMIWIESTLKIYALYDDNDSPAWETFDDTYCGPGCDPECEPGLDISPYRPPGQYQPCRGFGKVWRNKVNAPWWRLGWSDMPREAGDVIRIQTAIDGTLYFGVYGRIFGLAPNGTSWTRYR